MTAASGSVPWQSLGLPCGSEGPVFAQPWQGQLFAMTLILHERGLFTWPQWAELLSAAIRDAQAAGDPDLGDTYYQHWCTALETLLRNKAVAAPLALASLQQAWRVAAQTTAHGAPLQLRRDPLSRS